MNNDFTIMQYHSVAHISRQHVSQVLQDSRKCCFFSDVTLRLQIVDTKHFMSNESEKKKCYIHR